MRNFVAKFAFAALLAATPAVPAFAQVAIGQVAPGMQVYDASEGLIGAVLKVQDGEVVVQTDKHPIPVNPASFALQNGKLYLGMTRAQLNSEFETSLAAARDSLMVGKPVKGIEGSVLGTIDSIDSEKVVIKLSSGQPIQLPRTGIAGRVGGAVVGISAADIAKQLGGATAAPAPAKSAEAGATAGAN